jgi:hypothetical protein
MPSYRKGRLHQEFMANIDRHPQDIISAFSNVFNIEKNQHQLDSKELAHLVSLLKIC